MVIVTDVGFGSEDLQPSNLKVCKKGTWNDRMRVETALFTLRLSTKKMRSRTWKGLEVYLGDMLALFNLLIGGFGL